MWSNSAVTAEEKADVNESLAYYEEMEKKSVTCICPKCGMTHVLKFLWTGKGIPRKYCHRCREAIATINDQCIYESVPDVFRSRHGLMHASE